MECLLNVLCTINLCPVSRGIGKYSHMKFCCGASIASKSFLVFRKKNCFSKLFTFFFTHQIFTCSKSITETLEICSKLTIKTSEQRNWSHSGVFLFNLEHISHIFLIFLWLTLSICFLGQWLVSALQKGQMSLGFDIKSQVFDRVYHKCLTGL